MLHQKTLQSVLWTTLQVMPQTCFVWQSAEIIGDAACQTLGLMGGMQRFARKSLHDLIHPQDMPATLWALHSFCPQPDNGALTLQYRLRQENGHYKQVIETVSHQQNGQILSRLTLADANTAHTDTHLPALPVFQTADMQNTPLETFLSAWRDNRLTLAYQPVIDARTGQAAFYECLTRLQTTDGNILPASTFIKIAETHGLTRLIDTACLRLAIRNLQETRDLHLSINVATATFVDPEWLHIIIDSCNADKTLAARLIVEVTEHDLMQDIAHTVQTLNRLRDLGLRIAMDDFGAGQTALRHLLQLPISILKFDRSFISQMREDQSNLFLTTLQNLAHGLGLTTVAEGAESLSDIARLQSLGIDMIQGYAVGMPSLQRLWVRDTSTPLHKKRA
ncbi:MAG: EAL domain-containing protein [Pseudomonadota bacterium]